MQHKLLSPIHAVIAGRNNEFIHFFFPARTDASPQLQAWGGSDLHASVPFIRLAFIYQSDTL